MHYVNVNPLDLLETIREGILVLDPVLTVRFANRSFCHTFAVTPEHVYKDGDTFIMLKTDIESELLPTDRAIPIGLIVNELVTNAVKYAFPGEAKGTVMVTLKRVPGELRLTVADDGQGLDPSTGRIPGLGGRLVDAFAQRLGGQVERKSDGQGTAVHLILPSREGS